MRTRRLSVAAAMSLAALVACGVKVRAENLAADVPSDALVFAQWAGTDAIGTAYAASHARSLVDAFQLSKLVADAVARQKGGENDAHRQARQLAFAHLFQQASHAPGAFYVGPLEFSDPAKPSVKLAFFSKVGHDAAVSLAAELSAGIAQEPPRKDMPPIAVVAVNDFVLLTAGTDIDIEKRLGAAQPDDLAGTPSFKSAVGHVTAAGKEAAALVYVNGEASVRTLDDAIAAKAPPQQSRMWPMAESVLNLDAFQSAAVAGDFDGADWTTKGFISLTENRSGLAAFLDSSALPDAALALVPASATWATVMRFDGPRFLDDLRNAAGAMPGGGGAGGQKRFDFALQQVFAFTGVDVKRDLFPALGDSYFFYGTPDAAGQSLKNLTMVSPLKNAQKAESSLSTLEQLIGTMAGQRDPNTRIVFKTEKLPAPNDSATLHSLVLTTVAPSWTIANGNLYFSLTREGILQALADAGRHAGLPGNPAYVEARKSIPQAAVSRISFMNMPALAPEIYAAMAKAFDKYKAEHATAMGDYQLPALSKLLPFITPAISASWTDADGWHVQAHGDSPAAGLVSPLQIVISQTAHAERQASGATTAPAPAPAPASVP